MKIKPFILAAVLALGTGVAVADNQNQSVNWIIGANSWTAGFSVTHHAVGAFTDTFTFAPDVPLSLIDGVLASIGFKAKNDIDLYTANINGNSYTIDPNGSYEHGTLPPTLITAGPVVLTVTGKSWGTLATYTGSANVVAMPVPEPETYGMLLGGLAAIGLLARRRQA
ncbi:MAG: FxDxF family PEP-CTERM protein [Pseudomonadota bacterium]